MLADLHPATEPLATLTGVPPSAVRLRVLHLGGDGAPLPPGWDARRVGPAELRGAWAAADVVVLHGPVAGLVGRALVRGRRTTVLVSPAARWWPRPWGWLLGAWERSAVRWTNAVVLPEEGPAAAHWRRRWVPPFVVGADPEAFAAVLVRAHSFGWPGAATGGGGPARSGVPPVSRVDDEGERR